MFGCRRAHGLIAAALYESLDSEDQRYLDLHVSRCGKCQSEQAALARLVQGIPRVSPARDANLLPAVLRAAQAEPPKSGYHVQYSRFALAGALGAIALFSGWYVYVERHAASPATLAAAAAPDISPIAAALSDAAALQEERRYNDAYTAIKKAVDLNPDAPDAPKAMVRLADLTFDQMHSYKESYAIHEKLATTYLYQVNSGPDWARIKNRWEELKESAGKDVDFSSLYQLDAARQDRSEAFARLEVLLDKYPGRLVASAAAKEMAVLAARESVAPGSIVATEASPDAFEKARNHCTRPLAKLQLTYELANAYRCRPRDASKAIPLLNEVATSPNHELAKLAANALAEMKASDRTGH